MPITNYVVNTSINNANVPTSISGFIQLPTAIGTGNADVAAGVTAEIFQLLGGRVGLWCYIVSWKLILTLVSSIPNSISAFAGNPERRYMGTVAIKFGECVNYFEQINYPEQSFPTQSYWLANYLGRPANYYDISGLPLNQRSAVVDFDFSMNGLGSTQFQGGRVYSDKISYLVFPGISLVPRIIYKAILIIDDGAALNTYSNVKI